MNLIAWCQRSLLESCHEYIYIRTKQMNERMVQRMKFSLLFYYY